jgi:crotonobetainyl-CoA:carnitine CoA-transferase CaiB-like acyl-CoA transferase
MAGLLEGVKVIESAQLFTGDYAGQLLADEGADVVKFESPFRGDYLRDFLGQIKPHTRGHSPLHMILNRNKRSVAVDMRSDEGKEIFWTALRDADVFLDGNTTGATDALGVGYQAQRSVKPDIIYAQVTGLGAAGPYARVPTHGQSMSSLAGLSAYKVGPDGFTTASDDRAMVINGGQPVVNGPLYLAFGIAAALYRRGRTGEGAYIDVGCSDATIAAAWMSVVQRMNSDRIGSDETGMGGASTGGRNSKYNVYETKDGRFLLIALIEHHFWEHFCRGIGREDLLDEKVGYATKKVAIDWGPADLRDELRTIINSRTADEWMEFASEHDVVMAPVNSVSDLRADPQLVYREAIIDYEHPTAGTVTVTGNPIKVDGEHYRVALPAPALGEHTEEYLTKLGIDADRQAQLRTAGITN